MTSREKPRTEVTTRLAALQRELDGDANPMIIATRARVVLRWAPGTIRASAKVRWLLEQLDENQRKVVQDALRAANSGGGATVGQEEQEGAGNQCGHSVTVTRRHGARR